MALTKLINSKIKGGLTEKMIHKWDSAVALIPEDKITVVDIVPNIADLYIFDLEGLLLSLGIPDDFWYIHARINSYNCFSDYAGSLKLYVVESDILLSIRNSFNNKSFE